MMPEPFLPLTGITVLAWEQAVSLPMATRLMGDLGATVIRLESHVRTRQRPRYLANDLARNKLSIAVDLRTAEGQRLIKSLVQKVDVLCENFTPRVKRQFGLTYEQLNAEREDLIMLSLSGYGQTGAWSERPTFGPGIEAASGHAQSMGYPDRPPTRPGTVVYADNISGFYAAFAILAALHHRQATGKGQYIDLSMYEANTYHLRLSLARSSITTQPEARRGNHDPVMALQDVVETCQPERWLAVSVRQDQCNALANVLGIESSKDLAASLRRWATTRTAEEAAATLQQAGIAAAPALTSRDLFRNAQLRLRQAFTLIPHDQPVNGFTAHPHAASPWRFARLPRPPLREAPAIGQDSRRVLAHWLAMPDAEIDTLITSGVVGVPVEIPGAQTARIPEEMIRRKIDWRLAAGHDPEPERVIGMVEVGTAS
jgi:crotonobetainyl-CoA:carnitine CoA-transferase CaiB-like acyl-CoA transferase